VPQPWDDRLHLLHVETMVFGVMLVTIIGTLFTLWPTVLRSFMPADTRAVADRTLVLLNVGVGVGGIGDLVSRRLAAAGLLAIAGGVVTSTALFLRSVRRPFVWDAPRAAIGAGVLWLIGSIAVNSWLLLRPGQVGAVADATAALVLPLAVGFVGQVLIGSLTYLLPVVAGGGPTAVRAAIAGLGRWWRLRWLAFNGGLLLLVVPVSAIPAPLHLAGGTLLLLAVIPFIALAASRLLARPIPRS
jgi:nitrite reductase (NO-forming)